MELTGLKEEAGIGGHGLFIVVRKGDSCGLWYDGRKVRSRSIGRSGVLNIGHHGHSRVTTNFELYFWDLGQLDR